MAEQGRKSAAAPPLSPLCLRGVTFDPPLFCAPMANITHSAFRRLLADFGGYGALFTEMLSARTILHENVKESPWLKRRAVEGKVIYQLLVTDTDQLDRSMERLSELEPDGVDLNCACPAPDICRQGGGAALFDDPDRLAAILQVMRSNFSGPLTVKLRLGHQSADWRRQLDERLRLFVRQGVDALTIQPRFRQESRSRSVRHEMYHDLRNSTDLPIIANGDITSARSLQENNSIGSSINGVMIGRMAVVQPWLFASWFGDDVIIDYSSIWQRFCCYLLDDFAPDKALTRLKIFTPYFARNFVYGHTLFAAVQGARAFEMAAKRGGDFLAATPGLLKHISLGGI